MSGVRAGFINPPVAGRGGRQEAKGRGGQAGAGRHTDRCAACRYCGSLAGTSRFAFNKLYSSTTGLFLPSLRKSYGEIIDLIWNKSLGGAKLAVGMSAVLCRHRNSLGFIFNFHSLCLFHFCDEFVKSYLGTMKVEKSFFSAFFSFFPFSPLLSSLTKFLDVRG